MKKTAKIVNFVAIGVLTAMLTTVSVLVLGPFADVIQNFLIPTQTVDGTTLTATRQKGEGLAEDIEKEGVVLLKNDTDATTGKTVLPLASSVDKVNVFGWGSSAWVGGGSGSGRVVNAAGGFTVDTDFIAALNDAGIQTNTDLTSFYKSYCGERPYWTKGTLNSYDYQFYRLIEPDINKDYSDDLLTKAKSFSTTAIVTLSRVAGESSDAPKVQYKGNTNSPSVDDASRTYLQISTEEEALLTYVGENYENVIVVINSTNTMELGFLKTIPGLDAAVLCGGTGVNAVKGLVKVLQGASCPSGKLSDTYAYSLESAASYANAVKEGENYYSNGKGYYPYDGKTTNGNVGDSSAKYQGLAYVDYSEDIYIGYKWYETAETEGYWNNVSNAYGKGYDGVVQFPFGYGLSYTHFSWEVIAMNHKASSALAEGDELDFTIRVTNTGSVAGKDVVQLYYSAPYYSGQIEKSSVNLASFAKTATLSSGQFEDVKLSLPIRDMASYDCYDANGDGFSGYELDKSDATHPYEISFRSDAHTIKTLTKSAESLLDVGKVDYTLAKTIQYSKDEVSGNDVKNRFTGDDCEDKVAIDGENSDGNITYLTRSNFTGTFPKKSAARSLSSNAAYYNLFTAEQANAAIDPNDSAIQTGVANGLKIFDNGTITDTGLALGKDPNAAQWDDVLNEMSLNEMKSLTLHGYVHNGGVSSLGKPKFSDVDGPNQIGSFNLPSHGTGFPNATTMAQSWNKTLAYDMGLALGKEALSYGYDGWYGPGINLHRTPFAGRNYEYFSEDATLTGEMASQEIKGAKNCGVYCYLKHLVCYDQEENRDGLYTWLSEQNLRENYLKPFKLAIQKGGATGVMTSYNRIGAIWTGGSKALCQGVLRDEWGFEGCIETDYADHHTYMNLDQAIRAGGDLWMDGWNSNGAFTFETSSNTFQQALRNASKHILYMSLSAKYVNSIYNESADTSDVIVSTKAAPDTRWKIWVGVGDGVGGALLVTWALLVIFLKPKKKAEAA